MGFLGYRALSVLALVSRTTITVTKWSAPPPPAAVDPGEKERADKAEARRVRKLQIKRNGGKR